eukprot:NODE_407_length_7978_cov_0.670009.p4 type:complete len:335 gc:universal NODE_407_length_7978_cov_0.670009:1377-373(-)
MQWTQFLLSYQLMINNIHPTETIPGAIVASVSKSSPNYWYSWTRDSALTMDVLTQVQDFLKKNHVPELSSIKNLTFLDTKFNEYVDFSILNQQTVTKSKEIDDSNFGEPKFNVDGTAFNGPWGRPQNDGPALRSFSIIKYLSFTKRKSDWYTSDFSSVIKADCEYVSKKLNSASYDLWEEVLGKHFYNSVIYDKALQACIEIAEKEGDSGAATYYKHQTLIAQNNIKKHLKNNTVLQTIEKQKGLKKTSNLDIATILAVLHSNCTSQDVIYASHPAIQNTLAKLKVAFFDVYPLNHKKDKIEEAIKLNLGSAFGRYPEDIYDGVGLSQGNLFLI